MADDLPSHLDAYEQALASELASWIAQGGPESIDGDWYTTLAVWLEHWRRTNGIEARLRLSTALRVGG